LTGPNADDVPSRARFDPGSAFPGAGNNPFVNDPP
jgi:hypothetical protein